MNTDKQFRFYGICGNKFKLDDVVWEALEDESDGYRSYLDTVKAVKEDDCTFAREPFATVKIIKVDMYGFIGYHVIGVDDEHVWLKVGTNHEDSYYPYFVFQYDIPKYLHANFEDLVSDL